jgi:hypothetical protein
LAKKFSGINRSLSAASTDDRRSIYLDCKGGTGEERRREGEKERREGGMEGGKEGREVEMEGRRREEGKRREEKERKRREEEKERRREESLLQHETLDSGRGGTNHCLLLPRLPQLMKQQREGIEEKERRRREEEKEREKRTYFNIRLLTAAGVVQTTAFSFLAFLNL